MVVMGIEIIRFFGNLPFDKLRAAPSTRLRQSGHRVVKDPAFEGVSVRTLTPSNAALFTPKGTGAGGKILENRLSITRLIYLASGYMTSTR
jgi:hypothetical protein